MNLSRRRRPVVRPRRRKGRRNEIGWRENGIGRRSGRLRNGSDKRNVRPKQGNGKVKILITGVTLSAGDNKKLRPSDKA